MISGEEVLFSSLVNIGILLPFPFYYFLWNYPQKWVNLCGKDVDPSKRMSDSTYILLCIRVVCFFFVATFSYPPWHFYPLWLFGRFLCFRARRLLGQSGNYYGVRFGKKIQWVTEFPYGYMKDPQYVGSILSVSAYSCWMPFQYILPWTLGYLFLMWVESHEDPATRAKPLQPPQSNHLTDELEERL